MTYREFRDKYNGQWIDYDGQYGCQCWDLAQKYFTECLEVPEWVLSGCGLVSNMLWQPKRSDLDVFFKEVSTNEMIEGDVVIWEQGHIAIFDNWDGNNCWYFSQNPNPCQIMTINMGDFHAFRLKNENPPIPKEVTPPVEDDEYKNQIEILDDITELRVRNIPSTNGEIIGNVQQKSFYNYYEIQNNDDYTWYKIADDQWIASKEGEWTKVHVAKKDEFINLKILDSKNDYVLVDPGKIWINKK